MGGRAGAGRGGEEVLRAVRGEAAQPGEVVRELKTGLGCRGEEEAVEAMKKGGEAGIEAEAEVTEARMGEEADVLETERRVEIT